MAAQIPVEAAPDTARSGLVGIDDAASIADADTRLTGPELRGEVVQIARGVVARGIRPGDRVLVLGRKSVEQAVAILGVMAAGVVVAAPYPGLPPAQMRYILEDLAPALVVVLDSAPPALAHLARGIAATTTVAKLCLAGGSEVSSVLPAVRPDDPALIVYTSGSTGAPKGVVFSHENLRLGADSVARYYPFSRGDRVLCVLPFCFDAGLNQLLSSLRAGSHAQLMDFLLPQQTARACEQYEITILTGVPALWRRLVAVPWPAAARASMRCWASTGGHVPAELSRELCALFPGADPLLMYGFTEAFRATCLPPCDYPARPTSIGVPIPHAAVAVVAEDGGLCGPGETGELVQFGPLVTRGYWRRPEDTRSKYGPLAPRTRAELLDPGPRRYEVPAAWLDRVAWSGDDVTVGDDGGLYFYSRRSLLIKSQGFRVSPTEVEGAVRATGLVADSAVVGVEVDSEEAIGLMAIPRSAQLDAGDLRVALMKLLPSHQVPQAIAVRESIPLTPSGKHDLPLVRAELMRQAAGADE